MKWFGIVIISSRFDMFAVTANTTEIVVLMADGTPNLYNNLRLHNKLL